MTEMSKQLPRSLIGWQRSLQKANMHQGNSDDLIPIVELISRRKNGEGSTRLYNRPIRDCISCKVTFLTLRKTVIEKIQL